MIEAAEGHFTTEALQWNQNKAERLASGITVADVSTLASLNLSSHLTPQFERRWEQKTKEMESGEFADIYSKLAEQGKKAEGLLEAPLAYDAVWAIALGGHPTSSPPNLLPSPQRLGGGPGGPGPVPRRLQL